MSENGSNPLDWRSNRTARISELIRLATVTKKPEQEGRPDAHDARSELPEEIKRFVDRTMHIR